MNPLGIHFLPTHQGPHHYQFIRDMQPGILKLVGSSTPDVQQIADGFSSAPNALLYLRNVARSEQHGFLWAEPVKAARQHVEEWHADIQRIYRQGRERGLTLPSKEQIRILGVNEPIIELFARKEDMSNYDEWLAMVTKRAAILDTYMVEFGTAANRLGYGAGLGNISSGQPANKRPGEYATFDWFPKTRKLLEATRGKNAYTCHEYWRAETGPEGHADWHAWRFMHLNVDCDIDVLECGVDQKITSEDPKGNRGWTGHMDAAAYVDQHRRYIKRARQDSRFRCETPFTLDGDKMWESFWIEHCMAEMVGLSQELRASQPPTTPTTPPVTTVHLPNVKAGAIGYVSAYPSLKLRAEPSTESAELDRAAHGEMVRIVGVSNVPGWVRVRYGDKEGFMASEYISVSEPKPLPTPEPEPVKPTPTPTGILDPLVLEAIIQVESGGRGFGPDGRLLIRFEAHIFRDKLRDDTLFDQHFRHNPQEKWKDQFYRSVDGEWLPVHTGDQMEEYAALALAQTLKVVEAFESISMGAPQVMGFNAARIGYRNAIAMFGAFKRSINPQLIGMVNYLLSDPALVRAINARDFEGIARGYNGAGNIAQAAAKYRAAYERLAQ